MRVDREVGLRIDGDAGLTRHRRVRGARPEGAEDQSYRDGAMPERGLREMHEACSAHT
jgi:hypothetical protein